MKVEKRRNEFEIRKFIRNEIWDLPTDTVAQSVERRREIRDPGFES